MVDAGLALYATLPVLAPVLMKSGHPSCGRLIYTIFAPTCHQLPERSFFLFGPRFAYTLQELQSRVGAEVSLRYIGSPLVGYKIAICERDNAVLFAALLTGLVFALVRHSARPLSVKLLALLCAPMAVDGFGQLLGFWESAWWSRVVTGALVGFGCIWFAFPHIEDAMTTVATLQPPGKPSESTGSTPATSTGP